MSNAEVIWFDRSSATKPHKNNVDIRIIVQDLGEVPPTDPASKDPTSTGPASNDPAEKDFSKNGLATLKISPTRLYFEGYSTMNKTLYKLDLELFREVEPENTEIKLFEDKCSEIHLILRKKDLSEVHWPRLLATEAKSRHVKPDVGKHVEQILREDAEKDEEQYPVDDSLKFESFMERSSDMLNAQGAEIGGGGTQKEDEKEEETGMPELEGEGEEDEVEALPSTGNPKIEEIP
ncbi:hypothetical protein MferCBS31731_006757 [Microsporum ferrugineum]